jgi:hypothetical protein
MIPVIMATMIMTPMVVAGRDGGGDDPSEEVKTAGDALDEPPWGVFSRAIPRPAPSSAGKSRTTKDAEERQTTRKTILTL